MSITFEEIARLAGVSKATVSRVVNNKPDGVSEKTREHVKNIIQNMNKDADYTINTRGGVRTKNIGLIVPDIANPFFAQLAKDIGNAASQNGYSVYLGNTDFSLEKEMKYIREFTAKQVSGIILISAVHEKQKGHEIMEKYKVPCVLLTKVEELPNVSAILVDNVYATYDSCNLLIENGAKKIAFIGGRRSDERVKGYKKALEEHNILFQEELLTSCDYSIESGYNEILSLERSGINYDSVIAMNDIVALGCLRALKELSYRIPEDIQLIGFDNMLFSQYSDPALTTIQQPSTQMALTAVKDLVAAIEKNEKRDCPLRLQTKLLRRQTTR